MQSSNQVWILICYRPKLLDRHIFETRLSNVHVWMWVAKLGPCALLKDLNLISDNSFPICIGWKCRVVKPWFKILKQIVLHQHVTDTQHDTDRCYSCVKVALISTFEQISDSWSHMGLSDKTPKKEQLFNGNFRSNRFHPGHLKSHFLSESPDLWFKGLQNLFIL